MQKVGIIGVGHVGADVAYTMVREGTVAELVLIDKNEKKVYAETLELADAMFYASSTTKIYQQDYQLLGDAEVVVISVATNKAVVSDRMSELKDNADSIREIVPKVLSSGFKGIFLVITNPCDVITALVQEISGFPKERVFGTGTSLDTMRMKRVVGEKLGISSQGIDGYVLGEHGQSQFVAWSTVRVGSKLVIELPEFANLDLDELQAEICDGGWQIFSNKKWTSFGIASATERIVRCILKDEGLIFPVSVYDAKAEIYVGQPGIVSNQGVEKIMRLDLSSDEQKKYQHSAKVIRKAFDNQMNIE